MFVFDDEGGGRLPSPTAPEPSLERSTLPGKEVRSNGGKTVAVGGHATKFFLYVYGISGFGKTYYMKATFRALVAARGRAVFVDQNGVHDDLAGPGVTVCRTVAELRAALEAARRVRVEDGGAPRGGAAPLAVLFQPGGWKDKFSEIWNLLYAAGNLTAFVDEAQYVAAVGSTCTEYLRFTQVGRNRLINMVTTCQSPNELHPRIRQNRDAVLTFCQGTPDYAKDLAVAYFDQPEIAPLLLALPQFVYFRKAKTGEFTIGRFCPPGTPDPLPAYIAGLTENERRILTAARAKGKR